MVLFSGLVLAAGCGGTEALAPAVTATGAAATSAPPPDVTAASVDMASSCARTVSVDSQAKLTSALAGARAGDCILLADGAYSGVTIGAKGTATAPIVIRAVHRLKATFMSGLVLKGAASIVLDGLSFTGTAPALAISDSNDCRLTRSRVQLGDGTWIVVTGTSDHARIDHCDIGGASTSGDIVNPTGMSTNTLIDHNYFHDLGATHTVTLGCCGPTFDYHDTGDIAEHNLFSNCKSGAELFSIKSSASTVRYNTVRASQGDIDIRSGRHDSIYGNWILNGAGQFGIRMYEDDHEVFDNYVESARTLQVGPGHSGHAQVKNATIVFNTFVGPIHFGDDANTNFSDNIVLGSITDQAGTSGNAPITPTYQANILFMGSGPKTGFTVEDPRLVRTGEVLAISAGSPAIGAAKGVFSFVTDDIYGTSRGSKSDIGAEQHSASPGPRRPLTTADVGPDAP
jgi:hypothetical protein